MAFDPAELEQVETRLFALRAAARKHQVQPDQLAEVLARYSGDLEMLESGEATLTKLEAAAATARTSYMNVAGKLSAVRRAKAAKSLEQGRGGGIA